jgi:hypothetical protein
MIEHNLDNSSNNLLWQEYVAIDYGRAVPEKGYKGFRTFVKDMTSADRVGGSSRDGFTLYFDSEKSYTWFLLKWG